MKFCFVSQNLSYFKNNKKHKLLNYWKKVVRSWVNLKKEHDPLKKLRTKKSKDKRHFPRPFEGLSTYRHKENMRRSLKKSRRQDRLLVRPPYFICSRNNPLNHKREGGSPSGVRQFTSLSIPGSNFHRCDRPLLGTTSKAKRAPSVYRLSVTVGTWCPLWFVGGRTELDLFISFYFLLYKYR